MFSVGLARQERQRSHTGNFERCQVTQIFTVDAPATENVNDIVNEGSRVTLSWRWYEPNALQFRPFSGGEIVRPCIVIVVLAISASETSFVSG